MSTSIRLLVVCGLVLALFVGGNMLFGFIDLDKPKGNADVSQSRSIANLDEGLSGDAMSGKQADSIPGFSQNLNTHNESAMKRELEKLNVVVDLASMEHFVSELQALDNISLQRDLLRALFKHVVEKNIDLFASYFAAKNSYTTESFTDLIKREGLLKLSELETSKIDTERLLNTMVFNNTDLETVSSLYANWASKKPQLALDWLEQQGNNTLFSEFAPMVLYPLMQENPELAITKVALLSSIKDYPALMLQYAQVVAKQNPYKALGWAKTIEEPLSTNLKYQIFSQWSKTSPDEAAIYIQSQPPEEQALLKQIAGQDIDPATMFTSDNLPEDIQQVLQEEKLLNWFSDDASAALNWVKNTKKKDTLLGNMIADLPRVNLSAAQEIYPLLANEDQLEIVEGIVQELSSIDEDSARRWIDNNIIESEQRLIADVSLLGRIAEHDPKRALDAAYSSNQSQKNRKEIIEHVVIRARHSNPEIVKQWIQAVYFSDTERNELNAIIDDR